MSNPSPKKRIGEPFLAIRHLRWRGSNNIQSMSAASRGVFVELLIEQRIYGCFPKDVRLLSKRTGFTKEILTKWLANHQHLLMECEGNTEYFVSKNYSDLMTGNDLAFQNLQTRLDIDQTREDKTRPDSGQQDGLSPTPDSESSSPATSKVSDARPARLKEVLGLPGEINKFCKDFHLLLYPKKDPKSYPPDWLEEFNSLWVGKQAETTLDELLSIAKWGIQESPVQEKTGFSWTAQIVDMKSFCKFVQKGTLTAAWSAAKRVSERESKKSGSAEARLKARGEKIW